MQFKKAFALIPVIIFTIAMASNAYARKAQKKNSTIELLKLTKLANKTLSKDFRIIFDLEKNVKICGGDGDAYIGQVEMNKQTRFLDENDHVQLKNNWVKIDKFYSIYVDELNKHNSIRNLQLFDHDNCLE